VSDDAVRVEHDRRAGLDADELVAPRQRVGHPEQRVRRASLAHAAVAGDDQWQRIAGRAEQDVLRVQAGAQRRAQRQRRALLERVVEVVQDRRGPGVHLSDEARSVAHEGGQRRSLHTLAGDVPDDDDPAVVGLQKVIEVPAASALSGDRVAAVMQRAPAGCIDIR